MSLLSQKLKKIAVVESDNTILITNKVKEYKDFLIVLDKPAPKSKLYNIIINKKKYVGYKINLNNSIKQELAQEVIRKQIVYQIVRGLTKKKFDFMAFALGTTIGYIINGFVQTFTKSLQQPQPQPQFPNPFSPLSSAIMVVGIIAVIAYFGLNMFKSMGERWW